MHSKKQLAKLKAKNDEYFARMRDQGRKLVAYHAPCCKGLLETLAAPRGQVWDTMAQCPHCGGMYLKITKGAKVEAFVPAEMVET